MNASSPPLQPSPIRSIRAWLPLLAVLAATAAWGFLFYFQSEVPPFEDAAMLLRYADHVAKGHGEVWNIGGTPVDGATDFLFMIMVAGLARLGMGLEAAARLLTISAHVLTVALVYRIHLRQSNGTAWAAALSALVVATGPGLNYCEALFGTTVFALAGLAAYSCFMRLMADEGNPRAASGFALAGILTGLIRPEGVVLVVGMLLSLLWYLRGEIRRQVIGRFMLIFCLPGLAY
ncbi:MAG TPA: hypothetical protein VHS96_13770, partial [Bacteroidia bacterium]|nr:hypothetical protein [Bacteroidia bacterium]